VEVEHELVLGREDVDVLVEDPEVSRRHASVRPVDGGLEIDDLGSSNGTFVNGVRVRETKLLRHGDEIRLGAMSLRVDVPPRAQATVMARDPSATALTGDGPPAAT
jgi:pSer/pThr/pTyr-binding forkhead associated (FHA) protein